MSRNSEPSKYIAGIKNTEDGDRLLFPVSPNQAYSYGHYICALVNRLSNTKPEPHKICGIEDSGAPQHRIQQATFLEAGFLQRWTLYILELAKIMRFEEAIIEKILDPESRWEKYIDVNLQYPRKNLKNDWEANQSKAIEDVKNQLIDAIKKTLTNIDNFKQAVKDKIKIDLSLADQYIRDYFYTSIADQDLQDELQSYSNDIITSLNDKSDWESIYEKSMLTLFRSHKAYAILKEEEDWITVYEGCMWKYCSNKAKLEGASWVEKFTEIVKGTRTDDKYFIREDEFTDKSVFYKKSISNDNNNEPLLDIVNWESVIQKAEFNSKRGLIQHAFEDNIKNYKTIVLNAATGYLEELIEKNRKKCQFPDAKDTLYAAFYQKALGFSIEYILEESAVFWILIESGKIDGLAYPFDHNGTNHLLYDCIVQLSEVMQTEENNSIKKVRPVTITYYDNPDALQKTVSNAKRIRANSANSVHNKEDTKQMTSSVRRISTYPQLRSRSLSSLSNVEDVRGHIQLETNINGKQETKINGELYLDIVKGSLTNPTLDLTKLLSVMDLIWDQRPEDLPQFISFTNKVMMNNGKQSNARKQKTSLNDTSPTIYRERAIQEYKSSVEEENSDGHDEQQNSISISVGG